MNRQTTSTSDRPAHDPASTNHHPNLQAWSDARLREKAHEILDGLKRIRGRWLRLYVVFAIFAFALFIAEFLRTTSSIPYLTAVLGFWVIAGSISLCQVAFSECPNCHRYFYRRGWWGNAWTRRCLNCRIPLRARPSDLAAFGFPFCAHCGYDLSGNTTGRCPECGRPIKRHEKDT